MKKSYNIKTQLTHDKEVHSERAVVPPIYQNSLFTMDSWEHAQELFANKLNHHFYSRVSNPSVSIVEEKLAILAGGEKAKLFASGMGAIGAAILSCINQGAHVVTINNVYGPTRGLLQNYFKPKFGIDITFVSGKDVNDFKKAITTKTTLIYLESPSSVVFSISDIEAIVALAKQHGIKTVIDNTWATPLFQKTLAMGVDLELHSCTKYLGGHSDIVAGVVIGNQKLIDSILQNEYELLGPKMSPFDAWLLLRSLRTFPLRMEQHQKSGLVVAKFLEQHPKVRKVNYPGLKSFPQYQLAKKQMLGFSGLMSFQLKSDNLDYIKLFFNNLKLFKIGVSWGGHESLIFAPAISYLNELSSEQFSSMGIAYGDMRISVGLEDIDDLVSDLDYALSLIPDM